MMNPKNFMQNPAKEIPKLFDTLIKHLLALTVRLITFLDFRGCAV